MVTINLDEILDDDTKDGLVQVDLLLYQLDIVLDIVEEWHWAKGFLDRRAIQDEMCKRIEKERRQPCLEVIKKVVDRDCMPKPYPDWYKGKRKDGL